QGRPNPQRTGPAVGRAAIGRQPGTHQGVLSERLPDSLLRRITVEQPSLVLDAALRQPGEGSCTPGQREGEAVTITHINPDSMHKNPAFSQGVLVEGGRTLYVGEQNGVDATGAIVSG